MANIPIGFPTGDVPSLRLRSVGDQKPPSFTQVTGLSQIEGDITFEYFWQARFYGLW